MIFGNGRENRFSFSSAALQPYAQKFATVLKDIRNQNRMDYFTEGTQISQRPDAYNSLKDFFINEFKDESLDAEALNEYEADMEQLFENDRQGLLENAPIGSFNPVIGMAYPMHKYFMMNNVFDNGGISKGVTNTPKFTITMEKRYMVTPDGKEIDLFYEQSAIKDAFDSTVPFTTIEMTLPEQGLTNILDAIGAGSQDAIAVESYISGILVSVIVTPPVIDPATGTITTPAVTSDEWINVNYGFTPGYGDGEKRYINQTIKVTNDVCSVQNPAAEPVSDFLSGMLYKNRLVLSSNGGNVKAVRLTARRDTSNGLVNTCSVKWKTDESLVEIGTSIPINIPVSPEEIKDVQALYGVNQLTKIMSMIKDVMGNWKDDTIKQELDKSYAALHASQKFSDSIDFALKGGYLSESPKAWRHDIYMDQLDSLATDMIQVWNDPNVDVTVIGRTDLIRKMMPIEYTTGNGNVQEGVALDFKKTVVSTDNRRFEFISTDKIRKNLTVGHWSGNGNNPDDLIILLKPRGTNRIMYMVYDYQLYIANDIKNAANPTLPAIHAFDRWKFYEYQPVQGRVTILNPKGII